MNFSADARSPIASGPVGRSPDTRSAAGKGAAATPDWRPGLALLWAAGSIAGLAHLMLSAMAAGRLRRAATTSAHRAMAADLAGGLGICRPVAILESGDGMMPMTIGILRPAILLPAGSSGWSDEMIRVTLLHELAHVGSGDVAMQLVVRLALILHWWNPLAWIAWRGFIEERERAADDAVLGSGIRASDYAGHLLSAARALGEAPFGAVAMARRSQLEGRLAGILDPRRIRSVSGRAPAMLAALAGVAMMAPLAAVRAQEQRTAVPVDVEATIRAAVAQKDYERLESAAGQFELLGDVEAARKLLEPAVSIRAARYGSQSVEHGLGLIRLASLESASNRLAEADTLFTQAAAILGERQEAAPALIHLGMRTTNPDVALDLFDRAVRLDPRRAGKPLTWMALLRERDGKIEEAGELYRRALESEKTDDAPSIDTMLLYGRFLNAQGRPEEGRSMLERSDAMRKALLDAAAEPVDPNALRIVPGMMTPTVASKVDPEYTVEARFAKHGGTVLIYLEVGPDGTPRHVRVKRGIGLGLDENAVRAVRQWRFKPGSKDGAPVAVSANIEVNFRLL